MLGALRLRWPGPPSAYGLPAALGQACFRKAGRRETAGVFGWLVAAAVPHLGCDGIAEVMEFRPELQST